MSRKEKKERKKKNKLQERLGMKMVLPGDSVDLADDVMLFDLNKITSKQVDNRFGIL
jgi:putative aminopeptidase FrvX